MGNVFSICGGSSEVLLQNISNGDRIAVQQLLTENPGLSRGTRLASCVTPLHVAADNGRLDLVKAIFAAAQTHYTAQKSPRKTRHSLEKLLNSKTSYGQTALMLACRKGHADVLEFLLEKGADPLLTDAIQARNCLHYAALYGWANCISILMERPELRRPQASPANSPWTGHGQGHPSISLRYVDQRAAMGFAPLHMAASHGNLAAVVALIASGASISARCTGYIPAAQQAPGGLSPNATPLHIAAAKGYTHVVCAILHAWARAVQEGRASEGGADIRRLQDHNHRTAQNVALTHGHAAMLPVLDPDVPIPRLLAITNGDGSQPPAFGPPTLARLAAASLRASLDAILETIHALSIERAAKPAAFDITSPLEKGSMTGATLGPPPAPSTGARRSPMPSPPGSPSLAALQDISGVMPCPRGMPNPRPRRGPRRVQSWGGASTTLSSQARSRQLGSPIPEEGPGSAVSLGMLLNDPAPGQQQRELRADALDIIHTSPHKALWGQQPGTVQHTASPSMSRDESLMPGQQPCARGLNMGHSPSRSQAAAAAAAHSGGLKATPTRHPPQRSVSCDHQADLVAGAQSSCDGPTALDAYLRGAGQRLQALKLQQAVPGTSTGPPEGSNIGAAEASPNPSSSQGRSLTEQPAQHMGRTTSLAVPDAPAVSDPSPSTPAAAAMDGLPSGPGHDELDIGALLLEVDHDEAQKRGSAPLSNTMSQEECIITEPRSPVSRSPVSRSLPATPEHGAGAFPIVQPNAEHVDEPLVAACPARASQEQLAPEAEEENWTIAAIPSPIASPVRPSHSPARLSFGGHLPHRRTLSLGSSLIHPSSQAAEWATAQSGSLREVFAAPHQHVDPMVAEPVELSPDQGMVKLITNEAADGIKIPLEHDPYGVRWSDDGTLCGICCDGLPSVSIEPCGHQACPGCMKGLIHLGSKTAGPSCPFCRRDISGLALVPA